MADKQIPDIAFHEVTKRFGEVLAVDHVSFEIAPGSFHSFLGPSGCGKTTSLRLIAGFEQPSEGRVEIGGANMVGIPAHQRPVNMVFQHYALFPHLSVFDNVAYGLRQRQPKPDRAEVARRVGEALELVRLPGYDKRRTWELSGGQQQRVALARALINRPTVLLLDEPLSALDRKLRRDMQIELQNLQREVGITFVLVTHDQEEALSMSDSVGIMRDGKIVQMGPPAELYDAPVNRYVADFVGESNFFAGKLLDAGASEATIETAEGLKISAPISAKGQPLAKDSKAVIAVRPEAIQLWAGKDKAPDGLSVMLEGQVHNRIYLGDQTEFAIDVTGMGTLLVRLPKTASAAEGGAFAPGERVHLGWSSRRALALADT